MMVDQVTVGNSSRTMRCPPSVMELQNGSGNSGGGLEGAMNGSLYYFSAFLLGGDEGVGQPTAPEGPFSTAYTPSPNCLSESNLTVSPNLEVVNSAVQAFPGKNFIIPLYTLIFFLSFIGNSLVIITLARNRRMRTVTNVFLLNLAISDLLLGMFCMPFTLVGQILRNFIFGHIMCKIIPYFQAVSVSVGVWTLVAISLERYFAICRPLQSRKWQTRSHAYKMILAVWVVTLTWNIPITFVSQLQPIRNTGREKCREIWPSPGSEKTFNLTLDFLLLLLPLCIMGLAYSLIVTKLWKGLRNEILHTRSFLHQQGSPALLPSENSVELSQSQSHYSMKTNNVGTGAAGPNNAGSTLRMCAARDGVPNEIVTLKGGKGIVVRWKRKDTVEVVEPTSNNHHATGGGSGSVIIDPLATPCHLQKNKNRQLRRTGASKLKKQANGKALAVATARGLKFSRAIRSTYTGKSIESKKKVIRMLFVLVAEFFLCWTPLYVMHTWYLFSPEAVYNTLSPLGVSLIQLLAYISSCCNPITYCFMNRKFRQAFLKVFQCVVAPRKAGPPTIGRGSDLSANDSLIYGVQGSTVNKSVVLLECEDRV